MISARRSRLRGKQQGRLSDLFVAGATARAAVEIAGVNRDTARLFYHRLRQLIDSKLPSYDLSDEVEADESYFGGVRKCKRGWAAAGKVPIFGLLKRGGKVFPAMIPNARLRTLLPIIREQVSPDSIASFMAYDVLDVSEFHHRRVNHSKVFVTKRGHHINSMGLRTFGTSEAAFASLQRLDARQFLLALEGVRVALQWWQPPAAIEAAQTLVQIDQALVLSYVSPF